MFSSMDQSEEAVATALLDAQGNAVALFDETEAQKLIRSGVAASEISESFYGLAAQMYGISRYWHKRIVLAGRNTLAPYDESFLDVVGQDPIKRKLCRDVEAFAKGKQYFQKRPGITRILRSLVDGQEK